MGLTVKSTGKGASRIHNLEGNGKRILLCGNPNVGKSTLFNALTGLKQHTGNWTGKTVTLSEGAFKRNGDEAIYIDLPGCYSLYSHSKEEEVARDGVYFSGYDCAVVVCDASCLERNLRLAVQVLEISENAIICVNLEDEARRKGITVDCEALSKHFSLPTVLMSARKKKEALNLHHKIKFNTSNEYFPTYPDNIENYIKDVHALLIGTGISYRRSRITALRFLDSSDDFCRRLCESYGIKNDVANEIRLLCSSFISKEYGGDVKRLHDDISRTIGKEAEKATSFCVSRASSKTFHPSKADKILTGRISAFPVMLLLLFFILWLTVKGANYPSELLRRLFDSTEASVFNLLTSIGLSNEIVSFVCHGVLRVVFWVVSVMLPPMAIFFPLFTLLEDVGYLPRIAFNLDRCFKGCRACGKQALTMCMGLGCNAAGVVGCRIIDSRRERAIAILTNSLMPCNGRFPMLIAMIGIFFASSGFASALILALLIGLSVIMTLVASAILSRTVLRGEPSSFTLELPPFRRPNVLEVIIRSVFDRTLNVLGRAVAVAAPAGAVIWLLSNLNLGGVPIITQISNFLDPVGRSIGLDGVILLGFILGLPANEIVIPIILMCYTSSLTVSDLSSLNDMRDVLISNGWTMNTAVCFVIFTLFHWPCSTTILTVKKETGSIKKTLAAILVPSAVGIILCALTTLIFTLIK